MVFVIKTEESASGGVKRIEFAQFVEAILEKSPIPMHRDAIYAGVWGLMDKHLNLSDLDFKDIVSDLLSILRKKQFGLTESELLSEISEQSKAYRFKPSSRYSAKRLDRIARNLPLQSIDKSQSG